MKLIPTTINPVTITLYSGIPFDNSYTEHTLLSKKFFYHNIDNSQVVNVGNNKEDFIDMKLDGLNYLYTRWTKVGQYNFAFGNGLVTSVVMELTGDQINSNYMKVVSGSDVYYYFITGITQKNELTYMLNLELDVFMTYSEEFLTNIENKPVMVERKHCRRALREKINPVCFNQESVFSQLKSNIIKELTPLEFRNIMAGNSRDVGNFLSRYCWIYVVMSTDNPAIHKYYEENGVIYPYEVFCIPLNKSWVLKGTTTGSETFEITLNATSDLVNTITQDQRVRKIVMSPFPPFNNCNNLVFEDSSTYDMVTTITSPVTKTTILSSTFYSFETDSDSSKSSSFDVVYSNPFGIIQLVKGSNGIFKYNEISNYFTQIRPSINHERDRGEYKLKIAPFKKLKMSSYYGGEYDVNTQYLFLNNFDIAGGFNIKPYTITSNNPVNSSFFNFVNLTSNVLESKMGINNSVAYNLPTGSNAEMLFNQTQSSQYENSVAVNGISNALKMIGGGLAIAFAPTMGKLAGGLAIASGIEGTISNITSYTSKYEDLKNTPNTFNYAGSSFSYDYAISKFNDKLMLPYLIEYGTTDIEYNMGSQFIYNYGYEYNCESYFNNQIYFDSDNIFERRLFNYIKVRDDISTKLVGSNLPLIVAKKFSDVLNAGIKLWTFFGLDLTSSSVARNVINKYFQKDQYCNAEVSDNIL